MAVAKYKRPDISQWFLIPLSVVMLIYVALPFLGVAYLDDGTSDSPLFLGTRNESGISVMDYRLIEAPVLYGGLHTIPAAIWSITFPLQHTQKIRRKHPRFHRINGYVGAACSLSLGVTSLLFIPYKIVYTHKNWAHLHRLPLPWFGPHAAIYFPTVDAGVVAIAPLFLYTLVEMVRAARRRDIASHREWAIVHTLIGCFPAVQRYLGLAQLALGGYLASKFGDSATQIKLSQEERTWLGWELPSPGSPEVAAVETASFAFTSWAAATAVLVYLACAPISKLIRGAGKVKAKAS